MGRTEVLQAASAQRRRHGWFAAPAPTWDRSREVTVRRQVRPREPRRPRDPSVRGDHDLGPSQLGTAIADGHRQSRSRAAIRRLARTRKRAGSRLVAPHLLVAKLASDAGARRRPPPRRLDCPLQPLLTSPLWNRSAHRGNPIHRRRADRRSGRVLGPRRAQLSSQGLLSARCRAAGITPDMPFAQTEQGSRPTRSGVREERSALPDHACCSGGTPPAAGGRFSGEVVVGQRGC